MVAAMLSAVRTSNAPEIHLSSHRFGQLVGHLPGGRSCDPFLLGASQDSSTYRVHGVPVGPSGDRIGGRELAFQERQDTRDRGLMRWVGVVLFRVMKPPRPR